MRGGARRAHRRLSEGRAVVLCSAACDAVSADGSGRSRRPSSARIWSAIPHVGSVRLQHVNQAAGIAVSPRTSLHIGFARRPHSVTSTECRRREPEVSGINPGP